MEKKYAIVKIYGRQYKVSEGENIKASYIAGKEAGSDISFSEVLMIKDSSGTKLGKPYLNEAKILTKVEKHTRDNKITVFKYLKKNKSKKTYGHKQKHTILNIASIEG